MALTQITDHTRRAILNLPPPLWGKPRIASCLRAITDEIQELEDAIWNTMRMRLVDNATGVQLRTIGRVVGEPDLGYSDDIYRVMVKSRIRINIGRGTIDDILAIMGYAFGLVDWFSDPRQPAHLELGLDNPFAPHIGIPLTRRLVSAAHSAGVSVTFYTNVYTSSQESGLRFGDEQGLVPGAYVGAFADASAAVSVNSLHLFSVETTGAQIGSGVYNGGSFSFGSSGSGLGWGYSPWITL